MFATTIHFHTSLIFAGKSRSRGSTLVGFSLAPLPPNTWPLTNALAYLITTKITAVKSLIIQAPWRCKDNFLKFIAPFCFSCTCTLNGATTLSVATFSITTFSVAKKCDTWHNGMQCYDTEWHYSCVEVRLYWVSHFLLLGWVSFSRVSLWRMSWRPSNRFNCWTEWGNTFF